MLGLIDHQNQFFLAGGRKGLEHIGQGGVVGEAELREVKAQAIAPCAHCQLGRVGQFFECFRIRPILPGQLGTDGVGDMNRRVHRLVDPEVNINDIEVAPLELGHQILAHKGRFARAPLCGQKHAATGSKRSIQRLIGECGGHLWAMKELVLDGLGGLGHGRPLL